MTRRKFSLAIGSAALAAAQPQAPRIAITMDDFNWQAPGLDAGKANRALLDALEKHARLKIAFFVCGHNLEDERGRRLLQEWNEAGHWICNHTYAHRPYSSDAMTFAAFSQDMLRCDALIRDYSGFHKLFRFPALKEGDTAEKRDRMRAFLSEREYRNGHVTVDASDWYYDQRLRARLEKDRNAPVQDYRAPYLDHIWDRAGYYDGLARKVLGRSPSHTLLIHYNLLNSFFLDDLLSMFEKRGWSLIPAEEAFYDPVFERNPKTLPAGESLIWALAKESGRFSAGLRYPGEDSVYEKPKLDRLGL